jgi:serine protease AprX
VRRTLRAARRSVAAVAALTAAAVAALCLVLAPPSSATAFAQVSTDLTARLGRAQAGTRFNVIVRGPRPVTSQTVAELQRRVGAFAVGHVLPLVDGFSATVTKTQVEALRSAPGVIRIDANARVRTFNFDAQKWFGAANARVDAGIDGNADGQATYSSDDMVAAVLDTGIDTGHQDLDQGKVIAFVDCTSGTCTPTAPFDDNGHGTTVASAIAGDGGARPDRAEQGVAPGAALVGVKVFGADGSGTAAAVIAGIQWAVANAATYGIRAVNISAGQDGCSDGADAVSSAVNAAVDAGLVAVAAAGNSGSFACTIGSPAAAARAITVGAMADVSQGGFYLAPFSSRGPTADGRMKPDLVAPGVAVTAAKAGTTSDYVAVTGTSIAAPFVTGVALLMLQENPSLTPQGVKDELMGTAVDWGATGVDADYGAGRLDAYAALAAASAAIHSPPPVPAHGVFVSSVPRAGVYSGCSLTTSAGADPLALTMIMPGYTSAEFGGSPDFDIFVQDYANHSLVPAATHPPDNERQETVAATGLAAGQYWLRAYSAEGSGDFIMDVSGDLAAAPPVPCDIIVWPLSPNTSHSIGDVVTMSPGPGSRTGP